MHGKAPGIMNEPFERKERNQPYLEQVIYDPLLEDSSAQARSGGNYEMNEFP
jgi:hypothetical protein